MAEDDVRAVPWSQHTCIIQCSACAASFLQAVWESFSSLHWLFSGFLVSLCWCWLRLLMLNIWWRADGGRYLSFDSRGCCSSIFPLFAFESLPYLEKECCLMLNRLCIILPMFMVLKPLWSWISSELISPRVSQWRIKVCSLPLFRGGLFLCKCSFYLPPVAAHFDFCCWFAFDICRTVGNDYLCLVQLCLLFIFLTSFEHEINMF